MVDNAVKKSVNSTGEEMSLLDNSKKVILALQHLIAMFGATVLVPILTGLDPSVALFAAGAGTLIFHGCTKGKVPAFLGSSFAFIPVIIKVRDLYGGDLAYARGGLVVASLIYVIISLIIKKTGIKKIQKYLSSQIVGPMIMVIGLSLIPNAFSMAKENILISSITLGTALLINFKGKGMLKQISILVAVVVGYLVSLKMGYVNTEIITSSNVFNIPSFGFPKFDIGAILIVCPVVLAVFMEHLGEITAIGKVVDKNFLEDPGLHRTILGDGLSSMFTAFIGGPENTTYGENTAVLAITKNYDPSVLRLAAIFAMILAFIGKIGAAVSSIPAPVMGGISLMLFSMIAFIGAKTIKDEKVKFNWKNILIMSSILILGLGSDYLSSKLGFVLGIPITDSVSITGLSFAALVGIILNAILNKNEN